MASTAIDLLRKACAASDDGTPQSATLSSDGTTLTLPDGSTHDAKTPQTLLINDGKGGTRDVSYTLASIYLQLINPSVLAYRKACEAHGVEDTVKILDKGSIADYFAPSSGGDAGGADADEPGTAPPGDAAAATAVGNKDDDAMDVSDDAMAKDVPSAKAKEEGGTVKFSAPTPDNEKQEKRHKSSSSSSRSEKKDKDHHRGRSRDSRGSKDRSRSSSRHEKDRHHRSKSRSRDDDNEDRRKSKGSSSTAKAPMVPITNEQLVANLSTIVDKRDTTAATTPSKESKEGATDGEGGGAGGTDNNAPTTPAISTQTTPATTPMPTDDEGMLTDLERIEKEKEDRELLLSWLSPEGFQVNSPTVAAAIEQDRDAVRRITALEIPVGDSASILRAGAGGEIVDKTAASAVGGTGGDTPGTPGAKGAAGSATSPGGGNVKKRDFARVLEIFQEVLMAEEKAKRASSSSSKKRPPPPPPPGRGGKVSRTSTGSAKSAVGGSSIKPIEGNPIIVVPNAMTSAITMINAGFFLGKDAVFVPRDQAVKRPGAGKRGGTISITRKLNARLGGAEITYDIIDNPTTRLKKDEWNKVVAVVCQGASWQFKGWRYSDPVDLFSRTFGFYVGLEGAAVPNELQGWNVKIGKISRDRRGLDNVCLASFWNGLEEFIAVHKQGFIKS